MSKYAILAVLALCAGCSRRPPPPPEPATGDAALSLPMHVDAADPAHPYRTPETVTPIDQAVTGTGATYLVASEAEPATRAGRDILAAGGNAVDAAVATAFALAVVHPTAGNIGGGGFAVVRLGPGKAVALDFREVAPAAATPSMYLDAQGKPIKDLSLVGPKAAGVPGAVAGMYELHKKYGKKPWRDLVAPAIRLARDGFEIDDHLAQSILRRADKLLKFPATAAIWMSTSAKGSAGSGGGTGNGRVVIPDLARTLERIAAQGPDGFYKGETAAAIVAEMKAGGGLITAEDLAAYRPIWRTPLRFEYRTHSIVSMPPPSSGGIVLAMSAGMLRTRDLAKLGWHSSDHVHLLAEVWTRAFAARNELLGDPGFVKDMPIEKLTSQPYLDRLAASIGVNATPARAVPALLEGNHTTNLCVVDASGMAVALTTTLNTAFGSGVTVTGAGFLLNNEMDDFTTAPGQPNVFGLVQGQLNKIEPGKRMLSSMSPSIVEDPNGNVKMLAGAGGGPRIITAVWQTISNVLDYGKRIDVAVADPRVHHQHLPDVIRIEAEAIDKPTAKSLEGRKHELSWGESPREFGAVTAIARGPDGWEGTSDPRGGGAAMGDPPPKKP
ncbi:MAG: gamma-glutamyltransferase [Deltaproteobacteria bacterium]|nr:gamma-glutamyltransferase [Deltaproteobacteria bacterium]